MKQLAAAKTEIGPKRNHNQDCFFLNEQLSLYIVADSSGLVNHNGEEASEIAAKTTADYLHKTLQAEAERWPFNASQSPHFVKAQLRNSLRLASRSIAQKEKELPENNAIELGGFGSSAVALLFHKNEALIAHVGVCRAYRIRGGEIEPLTEEHTLLNQYQKTKRLTKEEIENFPHKRVVTRCLGGKEPEIDLIVDIVQPKDLYLLCTDGLYQNVSEQSILQIIQEAGEELSSACEKLLATATQNLQCDNSTVVLVRCTA